MKTSELITFLSAQEFTDTQAYNLLVADLFEFVPESEVAGAQRLVAYFMYKIQAVCLPAIRTARVGNTPPGSAGIE